MADTDDYPRPNPAARFVVLALTVAFYTLSTSSYFYEPEGSSALTYAYAAVGTVFFAFFVFASSRVCEIVCTIASFGLW
jgi:hypothetical protein